MRTSFSNSLPRFLLLLVFCVVPVSAQINAHDSLRVSGEPGTAAAQKPVAAKKNPTGAAMRSLAIPGWGQYYNGQKIKAALVLAAEAGEIGTAIYWNVRAKGTSDPETKFFYQDYRNQALWFLAGTIVLSMLDAYVDAHLFDFDESPSLDKDKISLMPPPRALVGMRLQIRL